MGSLLRAPRGNTSHELKSESESGRSALRITFTFHFPLSLPNMPRPETPLTRDQIITAAENVLRRFGPEKATVVDVARALGVSHAAVYRHVANKAALRDLVVGKWMEQTMPPLRAIAAQPGAAPKRLRKFFDTLIEIKRGRAASDPEFFTAYRALAAEASSLAAAHVAELVEMVAAMIRAGIKEGAFRPVDAMATGRAVLMATLRFHHPFHANEWNAPTIEADFEAVWSLLMEGLCVPKSKRARR